MNFLYGRHNQTLVALCCIVLHRSAFVRPCVSKNSDKLRYGKGHDTLIAYTQ